MKSLDELFTTIMSNPYVDIDTRTRAGYLRSKVCRKGRGFFLFSLFGH